MVVDNFMDQIFIFMSMKMKKKHPKNDKQCGEWYNWVICGFLPICPEFCVGSWDLW